MSIFSDTASFLGHESPGTSAATSIARYNDIPPGQLSRRIPPPHRAPIAVPSGQVNLTHAGNTFNTSGLVTDALVLDTCLMNDRLLP
jgi:hypothetical protein